MKRLAALALTAVTALLGGCATYDEYSYYDRDGYYDEHYASEYYGDRYYDRYYHDRYGNRVYYNHYDVAYRHAPPGYGWGPDYITYNTYYSALWPTYRYYYDPFWSPGFYYGVTYFPRTYFGLNVGWYSWPYYQAYSPYRYSHVDHYYDWWDDRSRDRASAMQDRGYLPRYGSARNEAQYLARVTGARGAAQTYYGASTQPGGIVDPNQARQTRARGGTLPFERSTRDWSNVDPYGRDGRGYGGFTGHPSQSGASSRGQLDRGNNGNTRNLAPQYRDEVPQTRSPRGYDRSQERIDGYVAPAPNQRTIERGNTRDTLRDQRYEPLEEDNSDTPESNRVYRRRDTAPQSTSGQFLPRQTREPYNPIFERHVDEAPQVRSQPQYEPRSREVYRSREIQQRPSYEPSAPVERSYSRQIERSEPVFQRSEPTYERPQRAEPSFERSEPRFERPQPSYESRSSSSDSNANSGGGRSSRGQLERIVRDDD